MPRAPAKDVNISVFFAQSAEAAALVPRPSVLVVPDLDGWNDYGRGYFATMLVRGPYPHQDHYMPMRMMFVGEPRTSIALQKIVASQGAVVPVSEIALRFCTLQSEATSYGTLVASLGFDAAIVALRHLRDVVLARIENEDPDTVALSHSAEFHIGMIRNSTRYTALRRGGRFLRPSPLPTMEDGATTFELLAIIPGSIAPLSIAFDFERDPIFEDRACVIIGRNGVGKTQLIKALVEGMTAPEGRLGEAHVTFVVPPAVTRTVLFSSVPSDPYRKAIPPWFDIDYEYVPVVADNVPLGEKFMEAVLDCMRDDGRDFGHPSRRNRFALLEELLTKLGIFHMIHVPVREAADPTGFGPGVQIDGVRYVPIAGSYNEQNLNVLVAATDRSRSAVVLNSSLAPRHLSSGELAMVQFCVQAVASIERGSLLIFDEPETHLHPNYVTEFMDILQDLLAATGSVAIIATHSAYVLREVPQQRVNVLYREGTSVLTGAPRMQTFGATLDELSQFVFQDGDVSPRHQKRLREWALETGRPLGIDEIVERFGEKLSPVTLSFIATTIRKAEAD